MYELLQTNARLPEESPAMIRMSIKGSAIGPDPRRSIIKPVSDQHLHQNFNNLEDSNMNTARTGHNNILTFARGSIRAQSGTETP